MAHENLTIFCINWGVGGGFEVGGRGTPALCAAGIEMGEYIWERRHFVRLGLKWEGILGNAGGIARLVGKVKKYIKARQLLLFGLQFSHFIYKLTLYSGRLPWVNSCRRLYFSLSILLKYSKSDSPSFLSLPGVYSTTNDV